MADKGPKYPNVKVQLVGKDGNAFSILSRVIEAMRRANIPDEARDEFYEEATSGDYDHLLQTVMVYVTADEEEEQDEHLWGYVEEGEEE